MSLRNLKPHRRTFTYTPTLVSVANLDAVPTAVAPFRVTTLGSKRVHVSGAVTMDPTAAATLTRIGIPLPSGLGLDVAAAGDISGMASNQAAISGGHVEGDATNNRAELRLTSVGTTAGEIWQFSFEYDLA